MSLNKSNYFANAMRDHVFRGTAYTAPATLYVALCTSATTAASTGSSITEPSGGSYGRVPIAVNTTSNFTAAQPTANANDVTFTTATGSWGTITDVAICDSPTGGQVLYRGPLNSSVLVGDGQAFKITAGNLTVQEQ